MRTPAKLTIAVGLKTERSFLRGRQGPLHRRRHTSGFRQLRGCVPGGDGSVHVVVDGLGPIRITKFTSAGERDRTYGKKGTATIEWTGDDSYEPPTIDGADRMYLGIADDAFPAVLAIDADGTVAEAFGVDGLAVLDVPALADCRTRSLALAPDGSVVVTGTTAPFEWSPWIARLTPAGELDDTFGDAGLTIGWPQTASVRGVVVDRAGRPVASTVSESKQDGRAFVSRFTS